MGQSVLSSLMWPLKEGSAVVAMLPLLHQEEATSHGGVIHNKPEITTDIAPQIAAAFLTGQVPLTDTRADTRLTLPVCLRRQIL